MELGGEKPIMVRSAHPTINYIMGLGGFPRTQNPDKPGTIK
jgi:hypothetical protein